MGTRNISEDAVLRAYMGMKVRRVKLAQKAGNLRSMITQLLSAANKGSIDLLKLREAQRAALASGELKANKLLLHVYDNAVQLPKTGNTVTLKDSFGATWPQRHAIGKLNEALGSLSAGKSASKVGGDAKLRGLINQMLSSLTG